MLFDVMSVNMHRCSMCSGIEVSVVDDAWCEFVSASCDADGWCGRSGMAGRNWSAGWPEALGDVTCPLGGVLIWTVRLLLPEDCECDSSEVSEWIMIPCTEGD